MRALALLRFVCCGSPWQRSEIVFRFGVIFMMGVDSCATYACMWFDLAFGLHCNFA